MIAFILLPVIVGLALWLALFILLESVVRVFRGAVKDIGKTYEDAATWNN